MRDKVFRNLNARRRLTRERRMHLRICIRDWIIVFKIVEIIKSMTRARMCGYQ